MGANYWKKIGGISTIFINGSTLNTLFFLGPNDVEMSLRNHGGLEPGLPTAAQRVGPPNWTPQGERSATRVRSCPVGRPRGVHATLPPHQ